MVLVIPELRLLEGRCLLHIKGEKDTEQLYSRFAEEPSQLCCLLRRENAKSIHITIDDELLSEEDIKQIVNLASSVDIPIQVSANFRDLEQCEYLLNNGVFRIFLCLLNHYKSYKISDLIKKFTPSRISAKMEIQGGELFCNKPHDISQEDFIHQLKEIGFQRILYIDRDVLKNKQSYNFESLIYLISNLKMKITLYDGIINAVELMKLNDYIKYGIDSVILGEALYNNYFPCQKIWRMAEAELEIRN
ncbi:MAG: HisA/HisF-related TIM barrel protein [bacterium]